MGLDGVVGCHLVLGIFVWGFGAWLGVGKSGVGLGIILVFRGGGRVSPMSISAWGGWFC